MVVVHVHAARQRQLVFHLQLHVDRAGVQAGPQHRLHLAVSAAVEVGQLGLRQVEVRHLALLESRGHATDVRLAVVARAGDPHPVDAAFEHPQADHAVDDALLGQIDQHRQVAGILVGLLQRRPRGFDLGQAALRAHLRQQGLLDHPRGQHGVALDLVLQHVETRRVGRKRGLRPGGRCGDHRQTGDDEGDHARHGRSLTGGHVGRMNPMVRSDHGQAEKGMDTGTGAGVVRVQGVGRLRLAASRRGCERYCGCARPVPRHRRASASMGRARARQ